MMATTTATSSPGKASGECTICLEPLDGSRAEVRLACGHVFCLGCTATTINMSGYGVVRCSLCRSEEELPTWMPCQDGDDDEDDDSDYGEGDDFSETMYLSTDLDPVIMTGFSDVDDHESNNSDDDAGEESEGDDDDDDDDDDDFCEDVDGVEDDDDDEEDDDDDDDGDDGDDEDEDDEEQREDSDSHRRLLLHQLHHHPYHHHQNDGGEEGGEEERELKEEGHAWIWRGLTANQQTTYVPSDGRSEAFSLRFADICGWYTGDGTAGKTQMLSTSPIFSGRDGAVDEQHDEVLNGDEDYRETSNSVDSSPSEAAAGLAAAGLNNDERSQQTSQRFHFVSERPTTSYQYPIAQSEWAPVQQSNSGDNSPTFLPSRYYGNIYDTQNCWGQAEILREKIRDMECSLSLLRASIANLQVQSTVSSSSRNYSAYSWDSQEEYRAQDSPSTGEPSGYLRELEHNPLLDRNQAETGIEHSAFENRRLYMCTGQTDRYTGCQRDGRCTCSDSPLATHACLRGAHQRPEAISPFENRLLETQPTSTDSPHFEAPFLRTSIWTTLRPPTQ